MSPQYGILAGCLALTLLLESPFYLYGLRSYSWKTRVTYWLAANMLSYPAVFFLFPQLGWSSWMQEVGAEIWAPVCEVAVGWFLVPRFCRREAGIVVFANLFSWLAGRLIVSWIF